MADRFREDLTRRAMELGDILRHETLAAQEETAHEVGDFKDAAAQESLANLDNAQGAHAAIELGHVHAALRRISDGSYGECLDCGDPIDVRRLVAMPSTPYCAACQSVHERAHGPAH